MILAQNILMATQQLDRSLSELLPSDFAHTLAGKISMAIFRTNEEDVDQAKRYLREIYHFMPPRRLSKIPGLDPFHMRSTEESQKPAFTQGMVAMFEKVIEKLSADLQNDPYQVVEQNASELKFNPLFGGRRNVDNSFKLGVHTARNNLILLFTEAQGSEVKQCEARSSE